MIKHPVSVAVSRALGRGVGVAAWAGGSQSPVGVPDLAYIARYIPSESAAYKRTYINEANPDLTTWDTTGCTVTDLGGGRYRVESTGTDDNANLSMTMTVQPGESVLVAVTGFRVGTVSTRSVAGLPHTNWGETRTKAPYLSTSAQEQYTVLTNISAAPMAVQVTAVYFELSGEESFAAGDYVELRDVVVERLIAGSGSIKDGDAFTSIADIVGSADLTQATDSYRPEYDLFDAAAHFDGATHYMTAPLSPIEDGDELYLVVQSPFNADRRWYCEGGSSGSYYLGFGHGLSVSGNDRVSISDGGVAHTEGGMAPLARSVLHYRRSGESVVVSKNGGAEDIRDHSAALWSSTVFTYFALGGVSRSNGTSITANAECKINEVIIAPTLTPEDRASVIAGLMSKWGIS